VSLNVESRILLAPVGSTGNNTHSAVNVPIFYAVTFQFVVEAVGTTVTYKYQGTIDGTNWFDVGYITDASDALSQATRVRTTTGSDVAWLSNPVARQFKAFRCVTSSNTGVTYRAELYLV
jgi:hypothetical protein